MTYIGNGYLCTKLYDVTSQKYVGNLRTHRRFNLKPLHLTWVPLVVFAGYTGIVLSHKER
jgi:hypothetical protein